MTSYHVSFHVDLRPDHTHEYDGWSRRRSGVELGTSGEFIPSTSGEFIFEAYYYYNSAEFSKLGHNSVIVPLGAAELIKCVNHPLHTVRMI